jgi:DNA-binding HxlR family transcriptional regulator
MAALDLLGRRWALRILWELRQEPLGARALLGRCEGLSPSVMYQRLGELSDAALVERRGRDYALSALGDSLGGALGPLDAWSKRWADHLGRR